MFAAFACAVASLLAAFAPSLGLLSASRMLMGAGAAGVIPLTMAWIGDRVPYEQRQEILARLLTYTVLGMILGAWAGGAIAEVASWRIAFVAMAGLFLVSAIGVACVARHEPRVIHAVERSSYMAQAAALLGAGWARTVFTIVFVEGALVFGALAFIPTTLHDRFQLTLVEAGGIAALFGLGGLLYSRLAGRLVRSLGVPRLATSGAALLALALATLAAMPSAAFALPACLAAGLGFYMLHNSLQTCATQLSTTARGTAVSLFACALFLGQSSGVLIASIVARQLSTSVWFALASPLLLVLGIRFAFQLRRRLSSPELLG
jgi:predicted MFS family arabinose efflux permease